MNRKEEIMQAACVTWLQNYHIEMRGHFFAINNNSVNKIKGSMMKALGVREGISDTILTWGGKIYFIEMKTEISTQSTAQKEFQKMVESEGHTYIINRSLEQFKQFIESIS